MCNKLTKADYTVIGHILGRAWDRANSPPVVDNLSPLIYDLCDYFAEQDPTFDRVKFIHIIQRISNEQ